MALDRYLTEEICLDHCEGQLSRREALRLLGLMGLGAASAMALLDAEAASAATATTKRRRTTTRTTRRAPTTTAKATTTTSAAGVKAGTGPTLATTPITFAGAEGDLFGSYAAPSAPRGAVLIIHENRGLTEHFQRLPGRFARDGYAALAVDLASRAGGTAAVADQMPAPLSQAATSDLVADLISALDELERRAPGKKIGTIGFCFGGGMVWNLLAAGDARVAAASPFYGSGPSGANFSKSSKTAVLAVYAELDTRVNADRPAMTVALQQAKLVHEVRTFPGVNHAFFNESGARHDPKQASAAYDAVLTWFARYLA